MKVGFTKCLSLHLYSETVDYQGVYSGGNGEVYALGVVPHSHIAVVGYSLEDGEIIKQVILIYRSSLKCCVEHIEHILITMLKGIIQLNHNK